MKSDKTGVTINVPQDIWQPLMEIRAQLDSSCPGAPTPIEEALREMIIHYKGCPRTEEEMDAFCRRAQTWKRRP
jgi:hypothetical protein